MTLYYQGGATAKAHVLKDGRKWIYIKTATGKYRVDKQTGEVQIAPYWNIGKDMYVED